MPDHVCDMTWQEQSEGSHAWCLELSSTPLPMTSWLPAFQGITVLSVLCVVVTSNNLLPCVPPVLVPPVSAVRLWHR